VRFAAPKLPWEWENDDHWIGTTFLDKPRRYKIVTSRSATALEHGKARDAHVAKGVWVMVMFLQRSLGNP
jgi:hypothetical protein